MGRKGSRYTLEGKLFYIGLVREEGWACYVVQREYGVMHSQVQKWVERFEAAGVDILNPRRTQRKYTEEFKLEVVHKISCRHTSYPALA
jgi:transposase-like protein